MGSSHLSSSIIASLLLLLLSTSLIQCDIYMHNPRGSNNRNCERNEDRNNDKRLFNSQNNDKGGYACPRAVSVDESIQGRMYYYAGSQLPIEWTNQHGCGNPNVKCQIILQYMCDDTAPGLRDGTPLNLNDAATTTIPDTAAGANNTNYGQHETRDYYGDCKTRERNKGLYTADRTLQGTSAIYTRQNNNGDRHGYECPEERDYYPYWHPTPWKDIAVLTDDVTNDCPTYTAESQNVKEKGYCQYTNGPAKGTGPRATSWYNNPTACQGIDPLRTDADKNKGQTWTTQAAWGLAAPQCLANPYARSNHLGNVAGAQTGGATALPNRYLWTVPEDFHDSCVIRIRYNISSTDFSANTTAQYNDVYAPLKQDPYVTVADSVMLALAVNTNQVGRVFQDRSYVFSIKPKPSSVGSATIHNLNVRGKRGNIVQVYPAVEYDFVPNLLAVPPGDYIHFQWTGSDYNPRRGPNDAEGGPPDAADNDTNQNARADRSNLVETAFVGLNVPYNQNTITGMSMFPDTATRIKMAFIKQDMTQCFNLTQLNALNANTRETHPQNCAKLNAAKSPYFDGGLVQMKAQGYYYYQSSRNNNFSNRDQKGIIAVTTDTANAFTNLNSLQERTGAYSPAGRTSFSYVAVAVTALLVVFVLTS